MVFHLQKLGRSYGLVSKKPKETLTRKEETLEVGLARHQKPKNKIPQWMIDYGVWIFVGAVFFLFLLPFGILGWKLPGSGHAHSGPRAQLVALTIPARIWVDGSSTKVKSVQVKVGNQGTIKAHGVQVLAVVRGQVFPLTGATDLEAGKMALYSGDLNLNLNNQEAIQVVMNCATCQ
jgi:hypothetical protein